MFTKTEFKWGVIFSVMGLVWLTLEYAVGLHSRFIAWHPYLTNLVRNVQLQSEAHERR